MAHEYGHARPLWGIQQLQDFWKRKEHPWNAPVPDDWMGVYPSESQWEGQRDQTIDPSALAPKMQSMYGSRGTYAAAPVDPVEQQREKMRRFRAADVGSMTPEVKAKMLTGGYDPVVDEEDEYATLLRMMFLSELMAGMAGGDPPTPYTVRAGPASRDFVPLNMYGRGMS